jgi:hypothetical protein
MADGSDRVHMAARGVALLFAAILLTFASWSAALAQDGAGADFIGETVRVTPLEGGQVVGTATAFSRESLQLAVRRSGTRTFSLSEIRALEHRVGVDSNVGKGVLWGVSLGFAAGVILGVPLINDVIYSGQGDPDDKVGAVLGLGAVGAAGGALLGAIFGAASSTTIWEVVPLEGISGSAGPRAGRHRGIRFALVLRVAPGPRG